MPFNPPRVSEKELAIISQKDLLAEIIEGFPELRSKIISVKMNNNFCFELTVGDPIDIPEIISVLQKPTEYSQGRPVNEFIRKSAFDSKVIEFDLINMTRKSESYWM